MYRATPRDGVAWITGASSGIGRAAALELARRGFHVAATARRVDDLGALSAEAAAQGLRIDAFPADVIDRAGIAALLARIEAEAGPVALALFNVGAFFRDPPDDLCGDAFRKTMALNLDGVLNGLAPLIPRMKARGRGQIAVTASVAGYQGLPGSAAYCASKSALIATCESLKLQLEAMGINLQVVCPGFVRTPMTEKGWEPKPFMIEVDDAARRLCDGLARGGFEIAFPRRMVWLAKISKLVPYGARFWIMRRVVGTG